MMLEFAGILPLIKSLMMKKLHSVSEHLVPVYIPGDPVYPLLGYLITDLFSAGTAPEKEFFSY